MNLRVLIVASVVAIPTWAGSIDVVYTDPAAWAAAAQADAFAAGVSPQSYKVLNESFDNGQLHTPLTIITQSGPGGRYSGLGMISNNEWVDAVGKNAILNGRQASYDTTTFAFGSTLYGVGFDMHSSYAGDGGLQVQVNHSDGTHDLTWPVGVDGINFKATRPYDGFFGYTSSVPIASIEFIGGNFSFTLDNGVFADPFYVDTMATPEPTPYLLTGLGLFGLGWLRKVKR